MKKEIKSFYKELKNDGLYPFELSFLGQKYKIETKAKYPIIRIRLIIAILFCFSILLLMLSTSSMLSKKYESSSDVDTISLEKTIDLIVIRKNPRLLERYIKTVKYLDLQDEYGWTALHWAAFENSQELIDILIKHGANPAILSTKSWGLFSSGLSFKQIQEILKK